MSMGKTLTMMEWVIAMSARGLPPTRRLASIQGRSVGLFRLGGGVSQWKRSKKVARKHGFEGAREHILLWDGWRVVRIGFTSWRPVPPLFSSCLALIGALDGDAQHPFCYASFAPCTPSECLVGKGSLRDVPYR